MNLRHVAPIAFPEFGDRYLNMMPFVMGDNSSIPTELHDYLPLIEACPVANEEGKIGYLTIDERLVTDGSHRRGGVHTEGWGTVGWGGGNWGPKKSSWGGGWGGTTGGLYLANSIPDSCVLYDTCITDTKFGGAVSDDQIVDVDSVMMPANNLFWIHDRTPHASLPCRGKRQFFRLVTSEVSLWFAQHSTPNRLGVQPAARIIHDDKFKMAA